MACCIAMTEAQTPNAMASANQIQSPRMLAQPVQPLGCHGMAARCGTRVIFLVGSEVVGCNWGWERRQHAYASLCVAQLVFG